MRRFFVTVAGVAGGHAQAGVTHGLNGPSSFGHVQKQQSA
ncbi:hypothetical protein ALQ37_101869 [Pseudomonas syringae pv. aptata]|uniref:Uncharacterized protein n=1 Tax=Pseudomonas syringae pv. aptata TaxID=83167 RepID=A0A0Q0DFS6_PSEAP|nr:hypothetical protein ALO85_101253 [Pseudomonas syringae pv. aptata]RMO42848.1 hypothetical protein ALQ40_101255 [Pseudomonas syringae]RMO68532.1 hypothetical protein ALQ37_101869 [Pseudomonas syringae pv. aptata]